MPVRDAIEIGEILAVFLVVVAGVDEDHLPLPLDQHIGVRQVADADILRAVEHDALRELVHRGIVEHPDRIFAHDAPRLFVAGLPGETRLEGRRGAMHRTACLPEIDCFESRRRPSRRPADAARLPQQSGRGRRRRDRSMDRAAGERAAPARESAATKCRRWWAAPVGARRLLQAVGGLANALAGGFHGHVVDNARGRAIVRFSRKPESWRDPDAGDRAEARLRST